MTPILPSIEEIILDMFFILRLKHLGMMSDVIGSSICNEISKVLTNPVASQGSLLGTDRIGLCVPSLLLKDTQWFLRGTINAALGTTRN